MTITKQEIKNRSSTDLHSTDEQEHTKPIIYNGQLVKPVNHCTCYGGGPYGHEPGCGLEPLTKARQKCEDMINLMENNFIEVREIVQDLEIDSVD